MLPSVVLKCVCASVSLHWFICCVVECTYVYVCACFFVVVFVVVVVALFVVDFVFQCGKWYFLITSSSIVSFPSPYCLSSFFSC